jgi:hypothetical protein
MNTKDDIKLTRYVSGYEAKLRFYEALDQDVQEEIDRLERERSRGSIVFSMIFLVAVFAGLVFAFFNYIGE